MESVTHDEEVDDSELRLGAEAAAGSVSSAVSRKMFPSANSQPASNKAPKAKAKDKQAIRALCHVCQEILLINRVHKGCMFCGMCWKGLRAEHKILGVAGSAAMAQDVQLMIHHSAVWRDNTIAVASEEEGVRAKARESLKYEYIAVFEKCRRLQQVCSCITPVILWKISMLISPGFATSTVMRLRNSLSVSGKRSCRARSSSPCMFGARKCFGKKEKATPRASDMAVTRIGSRIEATKSITKGGS